MTFKDIYRGPFENSDGIMTKPLRGDAISNLFIGETNWSYCLI